MTISFNRNKQLWFCVCAFWRLVLSDDELCFVCFVCFVCVCFWRSFVLLRADELTERKKYLAWFFCVFERLGLCVRVCI